MRVLFAVAACTLGGAGAARAQGQELDLATAAFAADFDPGSYCGEGSCGPEVVFCKRHDASQVDCVVAFIDGDDDSRTCGLVVRVVLRGAQLFSGSYSCDDGDLKVNPPAKFVRFGKQVRVTRFRAGIHWSASDEKNRYGVPHYDTKDELYTGANLPLTGTSVEAWVIVSLAMLAVGTCLRVVSLRDGFPPGAAGPADPRHD